MNYTLGIFTFMLSTLLHAEPSRPLTTVEQLEGKWVATSEADFGSRTSLDYEYTLEFSKRITSGTWKNTVTLKVITGYQSKEREPKVQEIHDVRILIGASEIADKSFDLTGSFPVQKIDFVTRNIYNDPTEREMDRLFRHVQIGNCRLRHSNLVLVCQTSGGDIAESDRYTSFVKSTVMEIIKDENVFPDKSDFADHK